MHIEKNPADLAIDENGLPIMYIIVYKHSSGGEPVEVLLDCSLNTTSSCAYSFVVGMVNGDTVIVGAQSPVGKIIQSESGALVVSKHSHRA